MFDEITDEYVENKLRWILKTICERNDISNFENLDLGGLKEKVKSSEPNLYDLFDLHADAYQSWHEMNKFINEEKLYGRLNENQTEKLIDLIDERDSTRRNLEMAVYGL